MKSKAQEFWHKIWERYVEKQKYTEKGNVKKSMKNTPDSFLVSEAIWEMSDKEFEAITKKNNEVE